MSAAQSADSTETASNTVLIVEDDEAIAELLAFKFETEGFDPVHCRDGAEGIAYLDDAATLPRCIILDLVMPGVDGMAMLQALHEDGKTDDVPVIVLTGRESDDIVTQAFNNGAADFVTKPFSPTALIARVRRLLQ